MPLPPVAPRDLLGKRLLGYLSCRWRRHRADCQDVLAALRRDLLALAPDHIVATGDLVNIALPAEFVQAAAWLRALGRPSRSQSFRAITCLLQASFMFEGGSAYLVPKVGRHSGVTIELTPWQRRHPTLPCSPGGYSAPAAFDECQPRAARAIPTGVSSASSAATLAKRAQTSSICARLCAADTLQRSRQAALGVPGGKARLT